MDLETLEKLKFPVGRYHAPADINELHLKAWIKALDAFPAQLRSVAETLTEEQLSSSYRPEGWTLRQVIHHLSDSHANAYIRLKLVLTEENPTIKPYFEERWAQVYDGVVGPIEPSLYIIEGIHSRLVSCLLSLGMHDFKRTYFHPEHKQQFDLRYLTGMYAWHGAHHLAQIRNTLNV